MTRLLPHQYLPGPMRTKAKSYAAPSRFMIAARRFCTSSPGIRCILGCLLRCRARHHARDGSVRRDTGLAAWSQRTLAGASSSVAPLRSTLGGRLGAGAGAGLAPKRTADLPDCAAGSPRPGRGAISDITPGVGDPRSVCDPRTWGDKLLERVECGAHGAGGRPCRHRRGALPPRQRPPSRWRLPRRRAELSSCPHGRRGTERRQRW